MKKTAIVLFLLGAGIVSAQNDSFHYRVMSCRDWNAFSNDTKVGWTVGYHDGLPLGLSMGHLSKEDIPKRYSEAVPNGLSYSELTAALDIFCKTPEYSTLTLLTATMVVSMKYRGVKQSEINDLVSAILASKAGKR